MSVGLSKANKLMTLIKPVPDFGHYFILECPVIK